MPTNQKLYTQMVAVSEEFLGPAGERFIRRQVETHLAIKPEDVKPQHLPHLVDWMRLMFTMITSDSRLVDEFTERMLQLAKQKPARATSNTRR